MSYKLLSNSKYNTTLLEATTELEEKVNEYLDKGYKLVGGVYITMDGRGQFIFQPVVKEEISVVPLSMKNKEYSDDYEERRPHLVKPDEKIKPKKGRKKNNFVMREKD